MARLGLTPQRLAAEGAELADEVGFDRVTASALAQRCGVKVASLYAHIRSTQDLKVRIALFALNELADRAAEAVAGRAGKDALVALGNVYRDYAREHPGRYAASQLRLDSATAAASAGPRHSQLARAVLRGYHLGEPEQTHAVRLLGSVFHGFASLDLGGAFSHSVPDSEESWSWTLDALDALLSSQSPSNRRPPH
ncbi:TetR/AcrR family transcriptional regulator [Micromonospora gifhornensis]|uniref:Transcriptional regulator n=1 Tax=Micromonospora gifhornensis TaxID=84594 RepID=A0ABQ4ILC1_9ACTN|nr:TetR/AcrR family transcriptional regulator [Micromonospora gifhornensis]GIJ18620.1 transcriptional regulator [Micromonospora gifhornensis]